MNEDIIKWARQAGIKLPDGTFPDQGSFTLPNLVQFAALVRADEREACAKLMDDMAAQDNLTNYYKVAARAIRERKS